MVEINNNIDNGFTNGDETITGFIRKIIYNDDQSGYTVAVLESTDTGEKITIVGYMFLVEVGDYLKLSGKRVTHSKFGEQFKVKQYQPIVPLTGDGIAEYLASSKIPYLGPATAQKIVNFFGKETMHIIDREPDRLAQVPGIGLKKARAISENWNKNQVQRETMIFLLGHGISPSKSNKIYRKYGDDTIPVVTRNPYMLSMDIDGIGFLTADQIARKFNFPVDSIFRIESGILYILQVAMEEGHVHVPMDVLHNRAEKILGCTDELITEALEELVKNEKIFIDKTFDPDNPGVYLIYLYVAETESATRLTQLIQPSSSIKPVNVEKAINWVETELQIKLAEKQKQAINFSLTKKVMILTGGPGTGKTTTVNAIVHIHKVMKRKVLLAAPTGRAAKRLSEITGHEARTIHRLLEYNKPRQGFLRNEEYPLDADLIIVDESSMIDILLFYHFLKAAPLNSSLLFVGDVNQLPSVGPGNVLRDLISPGRIPLVELDEIFRQAKKSRIVLNAHQINRGELPYFRVNEENHLTDFYFVKEETPEKVLEKIVIMVTSRIPKRFGLHPGLDIQVISPMNKGVTGVDNLNKTLQSVINPDGKSIKKRNRVFRINDKVMQTRNNYNKEIYNGDIGIIMEVDAENQQLTVDFDGRQILYKTDEIDELVLAYAISVHKSQGCEFKAVILPFLTQHYLLLQRNLLYTAITRGKNLVVIVGSPRAVAMAVKNDSIQTRNSFLSNRLEMYRATGTR